jgi:sugar/nucleoside kinase (ribokinase family)
MTTTTWSAVFVGNFVQDTILTFQSKTEKHALGGSVTFGSKAIATYASTSKPHVSIISKLGESDKKFMEKHLQDLKETGIDVEDGITYEKEGSMTSYRLTYTDPETNARELILQRKGFALNDTKHVAQRLSVKKKLPDLVFFVPVAAEFDAMMVKDVVAEIKQHHKDDDPFPIIITDIQGYVRAFDPNSGAVSILPSSELIKTLRRLGKFVFFLKCDYDEAKAALRDLKADDEPDPTPAQCAEKLHRLFGFKCVAVTMGPGGCVVSVAVRDSKTKRVSILPSSDRDSEFEIVSKYISAFTPARVVDETGSGDTFLACTFAELMILLKEKKEWNNEIDCEDIFKAVEKASAATSYLVERNEPHIFCTRDKARSIQQHAKRNKDFVYM